MSGFVSAVRRAGLVMAAFTACAGVAGSIDVREAAPRFTARTMDGERFTNESLKGRVVLLQFWTTWCRYCRADQDAVDSITRDLESKGLVVLAVNVAESRKKVKQYLEQSPRACKIALTEDTNLAAVFQAQGFPLYIVLDREGKIAGRQEGAAGEASLRRLLADAGLK
jgi:thiol-disulfide isomerase/thioredoxin